MIKKYTFLYNYTYNFLTYAIKIKIDLLDFLHRFKLLKKNGL